MNNKSRSIRKRARTSGGKLNFDSLLAKSFQIELDDHFIIKLIRKGCNVNIQDEDGTTPLHLAVLRPSVDIAHRLIKSGADMNAVDKFNNTALHRAVKHGKLRAVSLLLCYGVDVYIPDNKKNTPLMTALLNQDQEIARVLIKFYDDFSCKNISGETALDCVACTRSPLVIDMVKAGAGSGEDDTLIGLSLRLNSSELFEIVWPRFDPEALLARLEPFLLTYLRDCQFPKQQLVQCLNQILSADIAPDLVEVCRNYDDHRLMFSALVMFSKKKVEKSDRLSLIYTLMSLGVPADIADIIFTIETYGFSDELEALMYVGKALEDDVIIRKTFPLPACILAFEESTDREFIFKLLKNQCGLAYHVQYVLEALGYFSVPPKVKKQLLSISKRWHGSAHTKVREKLTQVPEVPSLLELSRNQARKFVIDTFGVKKPYQFHDAVKSLNLPNRVKDIVRFKIPIH